MKYTKSHIIAAIAVEVHAANDPHHVFAATQAVLGEYRRDQGAALARLVYTSARAKAPMKALAKGFQALVKRRDAVLGAVNTSRSVYGFHKYTLTELGVWSCNMQTGIEGSAVWQSVNSLPELMAILRHDQKQLDLLMAWGRSQAHGEEAVAAAAAITPAMLAAWEQSLLAIGAAVQKKGKDVVPFKGGVAMEWAVDSYTAATRGGKPGAMLRGVTDAVRAAINAAYFAQRNASSRDAGYALAGVVSGHRTAYGVLFPREQRGRVHVGADADVGQEAYAGAEDVVIDIGGRLANLGNTPTADELEEAIMAYLTWEGQKAERLLGDAEACMSRLTCGIKFEEAEYATFPELKAAIWESLAARGKERKEAAEVSKALQQAKLAVQVASTMDAVSRRVFLATQKHLDLQAAAQLLKEEALAAASRKAKAEAAVEAAAKEAAEEAAREAAYAATAAREEVRKAGDKARQRAAAAAARRESALDRELAPKLAKAVEGGYEFTPVQRETLSKDEYRVLLHKAVFA